MWLTKFAYNLNYFCGERERKKRANVRLSIRYFLHKHCLRLHKNNKRETETVFDRVSLSRNLPKHWKKKKIRGKNDIQKLQICARWMILKKHTHTLYCAQLRRKRKKKLKIHFLHFLVSDVFVSLSYSFVQKNRSAF